MKNKSKDKKQRQKLDQAASKLRKKGDFVSNDNLIPTHFLHEVDPTKANRAERRLIAKKKKNQMRGY